MQVKKDKQVDENFIMSPKADFVFKKIFGEKRNIRNLKALLSAILGVDESSLEGLHITNSELMKDYKEDKRGILDIRAQTEVGEQFDIEVQLIPSRHMPARTLYYWAKMYINEAKAGLSYAKLKKCITINILDEPCIPLNKLHTVYYLLERETRAHTNRLDRSTFFGNEKDESSEVVQWLKFINSNSKGEMEMLAKKNEKIKQAYDQLQVVSKNKRAQAEYLSWEIATMDEATREEERREAFEGRAKAEEAAAKAEEEKAKVVMLLENKEHELQRIKEETQKAIQKAQEEKQEAIQKTQETQEKLEKLVLNLLKENVEIEFIAKITGLTKEEIKKYKSDQRPI